MAFPVQKRVDLSFLGAEWQGAELVFSGLTFKETRELAGTNFDAQDGAKSMEFVVKFLSDHFMSGKGYNGEGLVPITVKDLEELPVEAINKSVELVTGQLDPKS